MSSRWDGVLLPFEAGELNGLLPRIIAGNYGVTQADMIYGRIGEGDDFRVVSQMPARGVVFSDGIEEDAIEFNAGTEITVHIADKKGCLVI